ncbi:hypothetical protein ACJIZ3_021784 [Penstemon smallii]|uniref:Uncharacterized protein n=1 Tax=Penstemon smallii TaxID=265156 RepID=A0ABD3SMF7_9LAMI
MQFINPQVSPRSLKFRKNIHGKPETHKYRAKSLSNYGH